MSAPRSFKQRLWRHFIGKVESYTTDEIGSIPCAHCGEPSVHQWSVCANGNRHLGVCIACDVELNRHALAFMRHPDTALLGDEYEAAALAGQIPD